MININYSSNQIEFTVKSKDDLLVPMNEWLSHLDNPSFFNVVNDLIVNGTAIASDNAVTVLYEDLSQLDAFEYSSLGLPELYPFDIFIDIKGTGLKDLNLELRYSFQDFSHQNGSGNILFYTNQLTGAHLKNDSEYLLNPNQFQLINKIKAINSSLFLNSNDVLKSIGELQLIASKAQAVLSKVLVDTLIITPKQFELKITDLGNNQFKIEPVIKGVESSQFQEKFERFPRVQNEYGFMKDGKKNRVVIDDVPNDDHNSLKSELNKLKKVGTLNSKRINEIYNTPANFWDTDLIDLEDFGARVLELGIYKPKFYPFISPYKSQWIPGIAIEDQKDGRRIVRIEDQCDLQELKTLFANSQMEGQESVTFKGEEIPCTYLPQIIENANKQLKSPSKPITTNEKETEKLENQTKVLIIKENTEQTDFSEIQNAKNDITYSFQEIDNLNEDIHLKDYQREGVAWLQTLSKQSNALSGVLLADDMGLGKTLQVLYYIEWRIQKINTKPVLIVAPVSLLENWQNEYIKFFPHRTFKMITLWGANVKNYIVLNSKEKTINNLSNKAIYLTTYETLRKQQIPLGLINWGVVILDEAQKIKTPGTFVTNAAKALKSDFKIAMTGTPVENSLMDLWCIVDFCNPGLLENAKSFSNKYNNPQKNENTNFAELSETLRKEIGCVLMRRMKVDVAKELPPIEFMQYPEPMPPEQFDIYKNELANIERLKEDEQNINPVLQGIHNLKSISDHPYLKHYRIEDIETHDLIKVSAKLKKVVAILEAIKALEEKAIVFTENKSMQRVLRRIISEYFEINPSIINGETPTSISRNNKVKLSRQQEIDKFQSKEGFNVIIMSPIAAGFGLNITEANHVIHYTRHWNPAKEQQATDRVYRIGQKKPVKVYYPIAVAPNNEIKTFDIVLDELLSRKSYLAESTLFPTEQIEIGKYDFINSIESSHSTVESSYLKSIESLDKLQPLYFESAMALLLEKIYGGHSWLTPKTNDKGADILLLNESKNILVQVKQSISKLGISSGQEISYALPEYKKNYNCLFKPQVITNSYFNQSAIDLANKNNVELIDREDISQWIVKYPITMNEIDSKYNERIKSLDAPLVV